MSEDDKGIYEKITSFVDKIPFFVPWVGVPIGIIMNVFALLIPMLPLISLYGVVTPVGLLIIIFSLIFLIPLICCIPGTCFCCCPCCGQLLNCCCCIGIVSFVIWIILFIAGFGLGGSGLVMLALFPVLCVVSVCATILCHVAGWTLQHIGWDASYYLLGRKDSKTVEV